MTQTIDIPGGHATFYSRDEVPPRRQRVINKLGLRTQGLFELLGNTAGKDQAQLRAQVSDDEADLFFELQDAVTWALLKEWDLTATDGTSPVPLPAGPDDILNLDRPLYDALSTGSANIFADTSESFDATDESLENPQSPTGA